MFVVHFRKMKLQGKIPFIIVAVAAWIVGISSCARMGMPTGGPRDSIPPVLLETTPEYGALNYKGKDVRFTFNEYINTESISEELVISPPMSRRPVIRTKSKTLIVGFNEDLKDSTTYSLDFKNSIADNNEKNPYKNLRFAFSTGDVLDTLRVAGRVVKASNLQPVEKSLVMLYRNLHDSAVYTELPDFIAKTDKRGIFLFDNLPKGKYNLFSITDANNNMKYDEGAEEISFFDSLIVPSAVYEEVMDTLVSGADSMLLEGHTRFFPEPVNLHQFTEKIFEQYIDSYKRESREKCIFVFNESVQDSFAVRVPGYSSPKDDWYLLEYNESMDSLVLWIADTTLVKTDSLYMEVSYFQLDSASQWYVQNDTLDLFFTDAPVKEKKKPRGDEPEKPKPVPQFNWEISPGSTTLELNQPIKLTAPAPVYGIDTSAVHLFLTEDTLRTPLKFIFETDTSAWRSYLISYPWEPGTGYTLEIDSAACVNIYGITSKKLTRKFTAREEDYYGALTLSLSGVEMPMLVQLVQNNDDEKVLYQKRIRENGKVVFDFLPPGKVRIKVIYDRNGNGKWDTGSFQDKIQPEGVMYINEVHKVRSNWEEEISWDVTPNPGFVKNIRDYELEEQKRKEAEKKAREDALREQNQNMLQEGGMDFIRQ